MRAPLPRASRPALAAVLFWAGCGATLVETRPRVKGPVSGVDWIDAGGGHARYGLGGAQWLMRRRREAALAKASTYCGGSGRFKIVDEVDREEAEAPYPAGDVEENIGSGGRHYAMRKHHHIYFECIP